jgi:pyrroline-5-carboxylate reductase
MLENKKLYVIGCGNMGSALVGGLIRNGIIKSSSIQVHDRIKEKAVKLENELGVKTTMPEKGVQDSDIIVLAIKPQNLSEFADSHKFSLTEKQFVVSVLAGVDIKRLQSCLGSSAVIIRAMPNTPGMVGKGITAISCSSHNGLEVGERLFESIGAVVRVDESLMNAVTALSGSGPAYVFAFIEALIQAGHAQGLDTDAAKQLSVEMLYGAIHLLKETGDDPAALREKVTSPGGTTEAALKVFSQKDFSGIVAEAVSRAVKRAEELAKN